MTKEEREKAISALKISTPIMALTPNEFDDYIKTLNNVMDWLEQEPKTGHWITCTNSGVITAYKCSECGYKDDYRHNYCSKCGAKMEKARNKYDIYKNFNH